MPYCRICLTKTDGKLAQMQHKTSCYRSANQCYNHANSKTFLLRIFVKFTTHTMKQRIYNIVACISLAVTVSGVSASEKVTRFTVNDGLSQHSVTSIIQDRSNMLWIGTFDGLNMFDGKTFKTYRHFPDDPASLVNNRIINLARDNEGSLWILYANHQIGKYEGNGIFRNWKLETSTKDWGNEIKDMVVADRHAIITDRAGYVKIFNTTEDRESRDIAKLKEFIAVKQKSGQQIISVGTADGKFWVSATDGIYCSAGEDFEMIKKEKGYCLKATGKGYIFLWKKNEGIICSTVYDTRGHVCLNEISRLRLPNTIQTIEAGNDGEFWTGTTEGLYKSKDSKTELYSPKFQTRAVYCDNVGIIWSGGLYGIESINSYLQPVHNYKFDEEDFSIQNHISSISVSPDMKEVWAGLMHGGLHLLTTEGEEAGLARKDTYFGGSNVSMTYPYNNDTLVVGTSGQLYLLVRSGDRFSHIPVSSSVPWKKQIFRATGLDNVIWIANGNKLHRLSFDKGTPEIHTPEKINAGLPKNGVIMSMATDSSDSTLLVGYRGNGIWKINPKTGTCLDLNGIKGIELSSSYIWSIYQDSSGRIWTGTDAGLNMLEKDNDGNWHTFLLSAKDGMRNDKIETIQEDSSGNIWAGTSQGIICYSPKSGKFITYDHEDGFQSNNFTSTSAKTDNGFLLFGGINGISIFNPSYFRQALTKPSVSVKNIVCEGKNIFDNRSGKPVVIRGRDIDIKIGLMSYYPISPNKIKYLYSINGDVKNEITGNEIILADMRPGKYSISISACTDTDNESPATGIALVIRRPLLMSWGAIFLYAIILSIIAGMIAKVLISRKILDNRLKMEEQLRLSENRMNTEKLNFYTNMAHEIKTPLSLILGRLYDIETCDEASPYIIRKVKLIGDNAQIIKELTEQILEFKRAVSGKMTLEIQQQDIMPCIRKIVDNYKDYAGKKGIDMRLESSSEKIEKYIDQEKIVRILYNLLSNAIKFSERNDTVSIKVVSKPDALILTVADTGAGITEEDLPHIFERFYKSGKAGGTGIGLAFTKSLVELMGGTITVSSTYGQGSIFMVRIPDRKEETPETANSGKTDVEQESIPVIATRGITPSILLIEDNVELNRYISDILSVRFKVHPCYNGKEALSTLQKERIDLVLSDIMMPGASGIEIARKIKNTRIYSHIPIVFLSAKTDPEDQIEGFRTGAVDYIAKPFNPHILLMKIQNILSQYFLSKARFSDNKIVPEAEESTTNRDEEFINRAREIIYRNMSEETFSVMSLSQQMGISRVHLTREFQRILSLSPSSFIKSIRLNHARYLLNSGNYSIKEVLWEIGIRSHSGFTKAFKEEFGYLPSMRSDASGTQSEDITETNTGLYEK